MNHKIDNGVILSNDGIPQGYKWFCDGRLSFSFDAGGVDCVEYYAARNFDANQMVFKKGIFDCFRTFIVMGDRMFSPPYKNVEIWPFGLTAELDVEGIKFNFDVRAMDESIVFSLTPLDSLPNEYKFKLQFYEASQLIPTESNDFLTGTRDTSRTWKPWEWHENYLSGGYDDVAQDGILNVCFRITANRPVAFSQKEIHQQRITLEADIKSDTTVFAITPEICEERAAQKNTQIVNNFAEMCSLQKKIYQSIRKKMPRLSCNNKDLSDFLSLAPLYSESLKNREAPGSIRAKTTRYWVWGWDAAVSNVASLYWHDTDYIRDMLEFFEKTASPEFGIGHAYATDNSPASPMAYAAQGMYICILHHYFSLTGDDSALSRHYPYAKVVLGRMMEAVTGDGGLMKGMSLYPDFPQAMMETGNDISLYNNSLAYCSLRAMEFLSGVCGDNETAEKLRKHNANIRDNFNNTFFDENLGAYVNSVDASTFERRPCVNIGSLMWENDFLEELVREKDEAYVQFIEKNCLGMSYFRSIPLWDVSYDGDANQLHCVWPVVEENVMRLLNRLGKKEILKKWAGWVGYWTGKLIIPEGISYMIETAEPETDRWNCEPGTWQAYTMRQWYQDVLHSYLGVSLDYGGVSFSPAGCGAYSLENLCFMGGVINIECSGRGAYISEIDVMGMTISGTRKIPFDMLNIGNVTGIAVKLVETPPELELVGCYSTKVTNYESTNTGQSFFIEGSGYSVLNFASSRKIRLTKDGQDAPLVFDGKGGVHVGIFLNYGEKHKIEVNTCE